jgi:hypothetical protein
MIDQFYSFNSVATGILKLFVLISIGYALCYFKVLSREKTGVLSDILLKAALPALIVTRTTSTFSPAEFPLWWFLPLAAIIMAFAGLSLSFFSLRLFPGFTSRREYMAACSFQNVGYLPMTLVAFICSGLFCDRMLVLIFLFIMGFNVTVWSFGPYFLSRSKTKEFKYKSIFNLPFLATAFSIASVFLFGRGWVPALAFEPLKLLGDSTFPLALVTLGSFLCEYRGHRPSNPAVMAGFLTVKLIIMPLAALFIMKAVNLSDMHEFFLFLESTMPAAVSLIIIGNYVGADNKFISGAIFYSHLFSIITIPLWLSVFRIVFG